MKKSNIFTIIILVVVISLITTLCYGYYKKATMEIKNPIVTMEVEGYGTIKLELYPEMAPSAVANFVALANKGFYNGTTFHRVVKDFMIQGGGYIVSETTDSETNETKKEQVVKSPKLSNLGIEVKKGEKDAEYCIKGEMLANGYNNTLKHEEGVISMARADYTAYSPTLAEESYNSATSQFFIMTKDNRSLDGNYAAFGKVIEGLDIVHNIENVEIKPVEKEEEEASEPAKYIVIKSVTVETYGVDYGKPETVEPWNYYNWLYEMYGINLNSK